MRWGRRRHDRGPRGTRKKSKPQRSERLGTTLPPQASKTSGQKVAPRSATREAVSWNARLRCSTSWKTSATEGEVEERWEDRSSDETEKSQASAKPETPRETHTWSGGKKGGIGVRGGASRVRRSWREEKAWLLDLRRDRRMLCHGGANHVPDGIVAEHPVTTTTAGDGMVAPSIQNFAAHATSGVVIPYGQTQTALESDPEEGGQTDKPPDADDGVSEGRGH